MIDFNCKVVDKNEDSNFIYFWNAYSNWDYLNGSFGAEPNTTAYLEADEDFNIQFDSHWEIGNSLILKLKMKT